MDDPNPILIVTPWYPTHTRPAAGVFVQNWARLLEEALDARVAVALVSTEAQRAEEVLFRDGRSGWVVPGYSGTVAGAVRTAWHLRTVIRRLRPSLINAHSYLSAFQVHSTLSRIPVVTTEHLSGVVGGLVGRRRLMAARAYSRSAAVTVPSETLRRAVEKDFGGGSLRLFTVPNPVVVSAGIRTWPSGPPLRILTAASLVPVKNLEGGLEAFRHVLDHTPAVWDIYGEGPLSGRLQAEIGRRGLADHVRLRGEVAPEVLQDRISDSHMVWITSDLETFSMVAAESLALGRPVVSTDCGGPSELVSGPGGRLVPCGEWEEFSAVSLDLWKRMAELDASDVACSPPPAAESLAAVLRHITLT